MSKTYKEKLLDPRWQKKRLEILERDEWCCQKCFDSENTLHVHHRLYGRGKEPWEVDNDLLVTLCAECHQEETELMAGELAALSDLLKRHYFADGVSGIRVDLSCLLHDIGPNNVAVGLVRWMQQTARETAA